VPVSGRVEGLVEGRVEGFVVGRVAGLVLGLLAGREEPDGRDGAEGRDWGRWTLVPVAGLRRAELLP